MLQRNFALILVAWGSVTLGVTMLCVFTRSAVFGAAAAVATLVFSVVWQFARWHITRELHAHNPRPLTSIARGMSTRPYLGLLLGAVLVAIATRVAVISPTLLWVPCLTFVVAATAATNIVRSRQYRKEWRATVDSPGREF